MLHVDPETQEQKPLQVEINTVAASFAALSTLATRLHRYIADRTHFYNDSDQTTSDITREQLPPNEALAGLVHGIADAFKLYCQQNKPLKNTQVVVLMVVQPNERNLFDQRWIEEELFMK